MRHDASEHFPDAVDRATEEERRVTDNAIRSARKDVPNLRPIGRCHYCREEVAQPKLYCDEDCANDHAAELVAKQRRNGRYNATEW